MRLGQTEFVLAAPGYEETAAAGDEGVDSDESGGPIQPPVNVRHIFCLPEKQELNPWFLSFLRHLTVSQLPNTRIEVDLQKSWFDPPAGYDWADSWNGSREEDSGHAPFYVLPDSTLPNVCVIFDLVAPLLDVGSLTFMHRLQ